MLDGSVDIVVLFDDERRTTTVSAGSLFVVPKGCWHRHHVHAELAELYVTPGRTEHSHADDPRNEET